MRSDEVVTPGTCPVTGAGSDPEPLQYPFVPPTALQPPAEWTQLRDGCPVAKIRTGDQDALLLTRYDDVRTLLSDPRFIREPAYEPDPDDGDAEGGAISGTSIPVSIANGEGHMRWRRLLSRSFTAKRMAALQPRIAEIAHELVDHMIEHGSPADLRTALGFPLPVYVICELLGVPKADRDKFAYWSDRTLNLTRFSKDEVKASNAELWAYMVSHVQAKRAEPGDDLLSELGAVVDAQDGRLSDIELVVTGQALLVAGHETTANMIGKMAAMLLSRRERWEQLLADRSLVRPAVEEVLRFDANLGRGLRRYITEPIEIDGVRVEPGVTVISSMPAANRDERAFTDPDEMDLTRTPNAHLTFGVGPHSCIGQPLARTELQTVLDVMLDRLPNLDLAIPEPDLRRREGLLVGGLEEVPVRW